MWRALLKRCLAQLPLDPHYVVPLLGPIFWHFLLHTLSQMRQSACFPACIPAVVSGPFTFAMLPLVPAMLQRIKHESWSPQYFLCNLHPSVVHWVCREAQVTLSRFCGFICLADGMMKGHRHRRCPGHVLSCHQPCTTAPPRHGPGMPMPKPACADL